MQKAGLKKKEPKESPCLYHDGNGPYEDDTIPKGCYFFRIPHKVICFFLYGRPNFEYFICQDGNNNKVGNPLAKGFISKISDGILRSYQGDYADLLAKCDASMHYWVNTEKRIR
jgi:DNA polymerase gamma 1